MPYQDYCMSLLRHRLAEASDCSACSGGNSYIVGPDSWQGSRSSSSVSLLAVRLGAPTTKRHTATLVSIPLLTKWLQSQMIPVVFLFGRTHRQQKKLVHPHGRVLALDVTGADEPRGRLPEMASFVMLVTAVNGLVATAADHPIGAVRGRLDQHRMALRARTVRPHGIQQAAGGITSVTPCPAARSSRKRVPLRSRRDGRTRWGPRAFQKIVIV
jgi:hypothetical protein